MLFFVLPRIFGHQYLTMWSSLGVYKVTLTTPSAQPITTTDTLFKIKMSSSQVIVRNLSNDSTEESGTN